MVEVLPDEPRAGGFVRALGGGRPAVTAFVTGVAGAGAFGASLLVDWQHVTVGESDALGMGENAELTVGLDSAGYAVAYVLGMLGLLALLGVAIGHPTLARRLRLGAAALGAGIVGVLVAIIDQMQDLMAQIYGFRLAFPSTLPPSVQQAIDSTSYAPLPGQFLAFAAVLALVAAVWLAAGSVPAHRRAATRAAVRPGYPVAPETAATSAAPVSPAQVGRVEDLTVTSADSFDPGIQADTLRN